MLRERYSKKSYEWSPQRRIISIKSLNKRLNKSKFG